MISQIIGAHFKRVREECGLTQSQAAGLIGLDQPALSRVEAGKQNLLAVQWLAFIFHVGVEDDLSEVVRQAVRKVS